jgi:eukaryotic-like serine/threonine-protein kinase
MMRDDEIFADALGLSVAERGKFLDHVCAGDGVLRGRVQALLDGAQQAGGFLDAPLTAPLMITPFEQAGDAIGLPSVLSAVGSAKVEGSAKAGRYKLLEKIGEGGCGVVWMAEQSEPVRRKVALKVIKLGMDTKEVIARFEAERQALALMDHPNIAKVHDGGATESGRPYFVMELVRGIPITRYCDENNLSTDARLKLFNSVCHAIQHAHQKGIIHRDIKPSNILVAQHDDVAVPKVIDFGIAKATQGRLTDATVFTAFAQFIGTPAYMSPEQAEFSGLDVDTRSDIYSLGVLLYELLTGRPPFDPKSLQQAGLDEIRRIIREVEPPRPSTRLSTLTNADRATVAKLRGAAPAQLSTQLSGDLDWIVMKALEKNRVRRYETVAGLAADIERHLHNEPVAARPASAAYRCQKLFLRHKLAFMAGAAIAASLVGGLTLSTILFIQEKTTAERAHHAERAQAAARELAELAQSNEAKLRVRAETEAARSTQVAGFLRNVLVSAGPSATLGRTSVRDLLEKTRQQMGAELQDQPAMLAELQDTLGVVYCELGERIRAIELHRSALAARRKLFGNEHADVATSLHNLAVPLVRFSWLAEAEPVLDEALAIRRKLLGPEHAAVADTLFLLADLRFGQGRYDDAERLHREVIAIRRKLFGPEHSGVADAMVALALDIRWKRGSALAEVESMIREGLAMQRRLLGAEHPDIAMSLRRLAIVIAAQSRLPEAAQLARESLDIRRKLMGNDSYLVAQVLNELGGYLLKQGKLDEAEPLLRESAELQRHDEPTRTGAERFRNLAQLLVERRGPNAETEALLREAIATDLRRIGPRSAPDESIYKPIREFLRLKKQPDDHVSVQQELFAQREAVFGPDPRGKWMLVHARAEALVNLGQFAEGLPLAEEAFAGLKLAVGPDDADTVAARIVLGRLYGGTGQKSRGVGELEEAERLIRATLVAEKEWVTLVNRFYLFLAAAYGEAGRFADARRILQDAILLREKKLGANSPWVALCRLDLAGVALREKKYAQAETEMRTGLSDAARILATADGFGPHYSRGYLGAALAGQGKFDEAEPLLIQSCEGLLTDPLPDGPQRQRMAAEISAYLIKLYEASDRPEQVARWKKKFAATAGSSATGKEGKGS